MDNDYPEVEMNNLPKAGSPHKTPLLDQIENGPWPSFVDGIKTETKRRNTMSDSTFEKLEKTCSGCPAWSGTDCVIPSPELGCPRDNIKGPLREFILDAAAMEIKNYREIELVRQALNGPYPAKDSDEVVKLSFEAGKALQRIGRILNMQGWDWDNYKELPDLLEKTISELAIDKRESEKS